MRKSSIPSLYMGFFIELGAYLATFLRVCCPAIHSAMFSEYPHRRRLKTLLGFTAGFTLGQLYYHYLLRRIPFPYDSGWWLAIVLSVLLGE